MTEFEFNRITTIPYDLELRDTIDAALYHLDALERAAQRCRELADKLIDDKRDIAPKSFQAKVRKQSQISNKFGRFLAPGAQSSWISFPSSRNPFAKNVSKALQGRPGA